MEKYDVLVVGSGSGMIVAAIAVNSGMKTALVESGPLGGTCLNRGCVPSKMLIYPADVVAMIQEAAKIGINASVNSIDFQNMMGRMHELVGEDVGRQTRAITSDPRIKWYKETGEFISDYTLKVGNETIKAEKIFIVSGARPEIPPIKGIQDVHYLTSDTVLQLEKPPNSMTIIGGGYIAAEYGHFFSIIGTKVTIIQRNPRLVPDEEPEISELLKEELSKRLEIYTNHEAVETKEKNGNKILVVRNRDDGSLKEFSAKSLLVAIGRIPNSDILKPEKTGVDLDKRGFIKVNEYLETRKKNIWAFGDAIGKQMFKHIANYEAQVAWHNALHEHKIKMDYSAAPHAVFTHPQIASVGLKEAEAKQQGYKILVGTAQFKDTAQGAAMGKPKGFVKVILEQKTGRILGGHIIGPFASMLIQEITNAMSTGDRSFTPIMRGMHIHPAMSEVVQSAFANIHEA
jgi:dihydrolipoamide dehydrogenase